jgi:hypothetical protein
MFIYDYFDQVADFELVGNVRHAHAVFAETA